MDGLSPKAAIYARFSTDLQNERSADDQIDLCRAFAKREGFCVVQAYKDEAKSGASLHGRVGILDLLADAKAGKFDVVIVENIDRMSRDMEDMAGMFKRLSFMGIDIIEVHGGKVSTAMMGMKATFAQMFREENAHKVRRGLIGKINKGMSAGGKAYGYAPVKKFDEDGDPIRGELEIVPEEATIVQRIYESYAKGISPKAVCRQLNAEFVKPPRGKLWSPSALHGKKDRGSGILRNPIYVGRIVWDKVRMVKDPDTGKRVSRPNPESEWKTVEVPELRIIPDELFEAVQAQMARRSHRNRSENIVAQRRPKHLLSGLLRCGACGSGICRAGTDRSGRTRLRCSAHTNSGACPNPKTFYADEVEELVIDSLTRELATPEQIKVYARCYIKARIEHDAQENQKRSQIEARIAAIAKDNDRLLDLLIKEIGDQDAIDAKMKTQGRERDELKRELARLPVGNNIIFHPTAIKHLADKLILPSKNPLQSRKARTELLLNMLNEDGELGPIVRELIHAVTLYRDEDDDRLVIKVEASLVPFLQQDGKPLGGGNDGSGGGT